MAEEAAPTAGAEETNNEQGKEFEPITSQEALDKIIQARVARVKTQPPADYDDLKSKAAELDQIKESQKSEMQKLTDQIAALAAERDGFKSEVDGYKKREQVQAWATEITKDSPIPASALRGSTREELQEHFEQLSALIPVESKPKPKAAPSGKSPQDRDKPSGAVAALRQLRHG